MQMADTGWALPSSFLEDGGGPALSEFDVMAAAHSDACVLFTGDTPALQTIARRIHDLSGWRTGPFEVVRCEWPEAVVGSLVERIFTDTEPSGALASGAPARQVGTMLLQDVWRLGPALQTRLADGLGWLRGEQRPDVRRWRLMASTSRPLFPRVASGTFDDCLFYRLNVIHLVLPSGEALDAGGL